MTHRDAQRSPLLAPRFGDVVATDLLRAVGAVPQIRAERLQVRLQVIGEHRHRDMVHPGGTSVRRQGP